jgi:hypothetical protein
MEQRIRERGGTVPQRQVNPNPMLDRIERERIAKEERLRRRQETYQGPASGPRSFMWGDPGKNNTDLYNEKLAARQRAQALGPDDMDLAGRLEALAQSGMSNSEAWDLLEKEGFAVPLSPARPLPPRAQEVRPSVAETRAYMEDAEAALTEPAPAQRPRRPDTISTMSLFPREASPEFSVAGGSSLEAPFPGNNVAGMAYPNRGQRVPVEPEFPSYDAGEVLVGGLRDVPMELSADPNATDFYKDEAAQFKALVAKVPGMSWNRFRQMTYEERMQALGLKTKPHGFSTGQVIGGGGRFSTGQVIGGGGTFSNGRSF